MRKFPTILTTLLLIISSLRASDADHTLAELSQTILENSPQLKQSFLQKEIQNQEIGQVGELPDPTISYSWFGENVETRVGPQEQKFSIQQKIPWPGKLKDQKELARKKTNIHAVMISVTKAELLLKVRLIWSDIQYLHLNQKIIDSTILLYQSWFQKLLHDYKSGRVNYNKLLKMQNEIDLLKDEKKTISRQLNDRYSILSEWSHSKVSVISPDPDFKKIANQTGEKAFPMVFSQNPNIQKSITQKEFWQQKEKLSRNGYKPDFSIGFGYIQTGEAAGMAESGKDPWLITVSMTVPLSFEKTSSQIKESQLGIHQANIQQEEQILMIQSQKEQSIKQIEEALRKRTLYQDSLLQRLNQAISVAEKEYQAGNQDFMMLLDNYHQRFVFQRMIYMTFKQEFQAKAKMLWLLGDESWKYAFPYSLEFKGKL